MRGKERERGDGGGRGERLKTVLFQTDILSCCPADASTVPSCEVDRRSVASSSRTVCEVVFAPGNGATWKKKDASLGRST